MVFATARRMGYMRTFEKVLDVPPITSSRNHNVTWCPSARNALATLCDHFPIPVSTEFEMADAMRKRIQRSTAARLNVLRRLGKWAAIVKTDAASRAPVFKSA